MPIHDPTEALHFWANALELGARGRYGEARGLLSALLESDNAVVYAMGASVRAHHLRELGDPDGALNFDDDALLYWEDAQIPVAWPYLDLKIGRSYDALDQGHLAEAGEWLESAMELESVGDERTSIRLAWCAADLALALGQPDDALAMLDSLAPQLQAAALPRLDVTSMLLRGRALGAAGDGRAAAESFDDVLRIGAEGMWHALMWRAAVERAEVAESGKERGAFLGAARVLVELISEDLTDDERATFTAALPVALTVA